MIFDQFKNLTVDRMVRATIGMSREKFDQLVPVFAQSERAIEEQRLSDKEIKCLRKGGPQGVLDSPEKRLFFTLFYLKTYPTFDVLGFHFNLSAGHAHDYIAQFMKTLEHSLETLEVAPKRVFDSVEDFKQHIEKYNKIMIDGMEVPCVRPVDKECQKARYSGKKKQHTFKSLVISNENRQVLSLSLIFEGHTHDYAMLKEDFPVDQDWFSGVTVMLDLGFLGAEKDYSSALSIKIPHKKPKSTKKGPPSSLTKQQRKSNREHAKKRVVVEHAIGGIKHFHCMMHRIRNHSISFIDSFFGISAGLWNLKIS